MKELCGACLILFDEPIKLLNGKLYIRKSTLSIFDVVVIVIT